MSEPADATRISELETLLAALLERVERTGGYCTPEDQEIAWRARVALGDACRPAAVRSTR